MGAEKQVRPGRGQTNVRAHSQVVRPRARPSTDAEIRIVDDHVYVTVHAPAVSEKGLRYAVRRRYLLIWDEKSDETHHLVLLPKTVDPEQHSIQFRNGVLDARIRLKASK